MSEKLDRLAFSLKPGEISEPVATDTAVVVIRVIERQDIVAAGLEADRETVRADLLQQQGAAFFSAYMAKAKTKMKIEYNEPVITSLVGG